MTTRASCKAHYDAGYTTDGIYMVDPDGEGTLNAFNVTCDMTGSTDGTDGKNLG